MGKTFTTDRKHTGISQTHKDKITLPYREVSMLLVEDETQTKITVGGHPLLTTQRENRIYVATEKVVCKDYNYKRWERESNSKRRYE